MKSETIILCIVLFVAMLVLCIYTWKLIEMGIAERKESKEKKRLQEERRREEEQAIQKNRNQLIEETARRFNENMDIIIQILGFLLKQNSDKSRHGNADGSDNDIDNSKTGS